MMTIEQRIKIAIGDLVVQLQSALVRIQELETELADLKKLPSENKDNGSIDCQ